MSNANEKLMRHLFLFVAKYLEFVLHVWQILIEDGFNPILYTKKKNRSVFGHYLVEVVVTGALWLTLLARDFFISDRDLEAASLLILTFGSDSLFLEEKKQELTKLSGAEAPQGCSAHGVFYEVINRNTNEKSDCCQQVKF